MALGEMLSSQEEYIQRINRVLDHIQTHLDEDLSLPVLARISCFSLYHFHRIFAAVVGETPSQFVQRLRLERAANRLCSDPSCSVTEVGMDAGFTSPAAFSRAFRAQFGMSATDWRKQNRKIGKVDGKPGKAREGGLLHARNNNTVPVWRFAMRDNLALDVVVRELETLQLAYVRHIGPYQGDAQLFEGLIGRLMAWAGPRGLLTGETMMLSIYHDNPEITAPDKLRVSMCITVPDDTAAEGEVGRMELAAGKYAMARVEITSPEQYGKAWEAFYGQWLPQSGYQPADGPALEIYRSDPNASDCEGKHVVDMCLPVRPL